jgi:hypothetical protein
VVTWTLFHHYLIWLIFVLHWSWYLRTDIYVLNLYVLRKWISKCKDAMIRYDDGYLTSRPRRLLLCKLVENKWINIYHDAFLEGISISSQVLCFIIISHFRLTIISFLVHHWDNYEAAKSYGHFMQFHHNWHHQIKLFFGQQKEQVKVFPILEFQDFKKKTDVKYLHCNFNCLIYHVFPHPSLINKLN